METTEIIDAFLAGVASADLPESTFSTDVVLDATVPNWRFRLTGVAAVRSELSTWFADIGQFEELRRDRIDGGELVEFVLSWNEAGVRHRCHQIHVLRLRENRFASDTAFCGGRWPEPLFVRMDEAQRDVDQIDRPRVI